MRPSIHRRGLTLVEFLVVIAIIAVLIAFLVPSVRRVQPAAARVQCQNNLKQIMLAMHWYHDTHKHLPPGCIGTETSPEQRLAWTVALLPYLEQLPLHKRFDLEKGYEANRETANVPISVYLCPDVKLAPGSDAATTYIALAGIGLDAAWRPADGEGIGAIGYDRTLTLKDIKDGTDNTLAIMESQVGLRAWARGGPSNLRGFDPTDLPWNGEQRPFNGHTNGVNAAFLDGSVRYVPYATDAKTIAAMITVRGGEKVNLDLP